CSESAGLILNGVKTLLYCGAGDHAWNRQLLAFQIEELRAEAKSKPHMTVPPDWSEAKYDDYLFTMWRRIESDHPEILTAVQAAEDDTGKQAKRNMLHRWIGVAKFVELARPVCGDCVADLSYNLIQGHLVSLIQINKDKMTVSWKRSKGTKKGGTN